NPSKLMSPSLCAARGFLSTVCGDTRRGRPLLTTRLTTRRHPRRKSWQWSGGVLAGAAHSATLRSYFTEPAPMLRVLASLLGFVVGYVVAAFAGDWAIET